MRRTVLLFCVPVFIFFICSEVYPEGFGYSLPALNGNSVSGKTVVGYVKFHQIKEKETLLDIARDYGLGFREAEIACPDLDPWLLEAGRTVQMPTCWIIPNSRYYGIVINLAELRLYHFFPRIGMVKTYPIGIGDIGWETPEGVYSIVTREIDPEWFIPSVLREKYEVHKVPSGPNNPLGRYWLGLSRKGYGIHGTNLPWSVGRLVSHGCIRLYPEHIQQLFEEVAVNTPVEIVYEPVKVGLKYTEIFMEVHPDLYKKVADIEEHTRNILQKTGFWEYISWEVVMRLLKQPDGIPVNIGRIGEGG